MDFEKKFADAQKNVLARIRFYKHLFSFFTGNIFLCVFDLFTSPGMLWFYWPLLVWSLFVGAHAKIALSSDKGENKKIA